MASTPKISIIVPVYNVEKYLPQCLDSLINQTLEDIEIICINDASPDNSLQILKEYQKKDNRIQVIDLKENIRQGGARNIGIKKAKGEFIGFVDSDDYVKPDMYEKLYYKAKTCNAKVAYGGQIHLFYDGTEKEYIFHKEFDIEKCNYKSLIEIFVFQGINVVCGIFKKDIITDNNLFFPEKIFYEDNVITTLLYTISGKACKVDESFYYYRIHPNSTTTKTSFDKLRDRITSCDLLIEKWEEIGLYEEYKDYVNYTYINLLERTIIWSMQLKCKDAYKIIHKIIRRIKNKIPNKYFSPKQSTIFLLKHKYMGFLYLCLRYNKHILNIYHKLK